MTFWNDSYQSELNNITNWINVNLINKSNIPSDLDAIDDEQFPDAVLVHAWVYFSFLFNNRRESLNKYTRFNQKHLQERAIPSLDELKSNRFYFLSNLLRVVYEYYFWTQESDSRPVFVNTRVLERLDRLSTATDYNVQFIWIERSMPAALTMSILVSDEFDTLRKIANDVSGYEEKFTNQIDSGTQKANEKIEKISVNRLC